MIVLVNLYYFTFFSKARHLLGFLFLLIISCSRIESVEEINGMAWGTSYSIQIVEDSNVNMSITSIKMDIDSIINNIDKLTDIGYPILIGASRKSLIGKTLNVDENNRIEGTIVSNIIALDLSLIHI